MANNNLTVATEQCHKVITYLTQQNWIDQDKMIFCGGSEGFTVGANLLANFKTKITHAILFSGHVGRRFENEIFQLREASRQGKMSSQESQNQIEELYKIWEDICQNPTAINKTYGDTYYANHSFSFNNVDNLLKINCPLYIAYGTDDNEIAAGLDYLPLAFIDKGKKNLILRAYPNHNHQFFEQKKDDNNQVIDKIYRGDEVAKEWMDWIKKK
jgi:pimeloyl-ACP methyl ester carboxylesterase